MADRLKDADVGVWRTCSMSVIRNDTVFMSAIFKCRDMRTISLISSDLFYTN